MIINILVLFLLTGLGIAFSRGKLLFVLSGFNTMSSQEKNHYDISSLGKFMSKIMFSLTFCIVLFLLSELLSIKVLSYIGGTLIFAIVAFVVVYTNSKDRFIKQ